MCKLYGVLCSPLSERSETAALEGEATCSCRVLEGSKAKCSLLNRLDQETHAAMGRGHHITPNSLSRLCPLHLPAITGHRRNLMWNMAIKMGLLKQRPHTNQRERPFTKKFSIVTTPYQLILDDPLPKIPLCSHH